MPIKTSFTKIGLQKLEPGIDLGKQITSIECDMVEEQFTEMFLTKQRRYWSDGSPVIIKIQHPERKGVFMDWHMEEVPSLAKLTKNQMREFFDAIRDHYLHNCGLDIQIGDDLFPSR